MKLLLYKVNPFNLTLELEQYELDSLTDYRCKDFNRVTLNTTAYRLYIDYID